MKNKSQESYRKITRIEKELQNSNKQLQFGYNLETISGITKWLQNGYNLVTKSYKMVTK